MNKITVGMRHDELERPEVIGVLSLPQTNNNTPACPPSENYNGNLLLTLTFMCERRSRVKSLKT